MTTITEEIVNFTLISLQSRRKQVRKPRKGEDLDELKQELDIDYHKISPEELYQRFQTHPENVSREIDINYGAMNCCNGWFTMLDCE